MSSFNLGQPVPRDAPCEEDVRCELRRILSSPRLEASERRRAFLSYIVEETLAGRAGALKGYTIAVAVFGRDEGFDPQSDPVVRIEARRLRRDLNGYYVDAGGHDPVRIWIPTGSYVPQFDWYDLGGTPPGGREAERAGSLGPSTPRPADTDRPPPGREGHAWRCFQIAAALAMILAVVVAGWILTLESRAFTSARSEPAVVILPFEVLGATDESRYLAVGIRQELTKKLMRIPNFRLYAPPADIDSGHGAVLDGSGRGSHVDYAVTGNVRAQDGQVWLAMQLVDVASSRVLWVETYNRPLAPGALLRVQVDLAEEVAAVLAQDRFHGP